MIQKWMKNYFVILILNWVYVFRKCLVTKIPCMCWLIRKSNFFSLINKYIKKCVFLHDRPVICPWSSTIADLGHNWSVKHIYKHYLTKSIYMYKCTCVHTCFKSKKLHWLYYTFKNIYKHVKTTWNFHQTESHFFQNAIRICQKKNSLLIIVLIYLLLPHAPECIFMFAEEQKFCWRHLHVK